MVYLYACEFCKEETDVVKPVALWDRQELCKSCGSAMTRVITGRVYLNNTAVQEAYWSPALGKIVKGKDHERKLAKEKGWVEVGNEKMTHNPTKQKYEI